MPEWIVVEVALEVEEVVFEVAVEVVVVFEVEVVAVEVVVVVHQHQAHSPPAHMLVFLRLRFRIGT